MAYKSAGVKMPSRIAKGDLAAEESGREVPELLLWFPCLVLTQPENLLHCIHEAFCEHALLRRAAKGDTEGDLVGCRGRGHRN